jgi:hypothetical protein
MPAWDEGHIPNMEDLLSQYAVQELQTLELELAKREQESLRLFQPLPFQQEYLACKTKECIIQKGNQVGGTLVGAVEMARALTGQDPHNKYPKKDGVAVVIGYGEKHIGRVIHKALFRAGAFKMIRDLETKKWRVFHPERDAGREAEVKPAPPLIPPRMVEEIVWENKGNRVFSVVRMKNGWELYAMNSAGDPSQAQGFEADLVWIDEDLATDGWYDEMVGRTLMRQGKIRMTALPHAKTADIVNFIERGQADLERPPEQRNTTLVRATLFDNVYMTQQSVTDTLRLWQSQGDDVYRARIMGELTTDGQLMYPSFNKHIHGLRLTHDDWRNAHPIERIIHDNNDQIPADWCRYMIVDPGHKVCAVVFVAVPPPALGEHKIVYRTLYIQQCDGQKFGHYVGMEARDQTFQAFIIDAHGGALTDFGSGVTPREQYSQKLREHNIKSEETGFNFISGCDDVHGRAMILRDWMGIRRDGTPMFRVIPQRCPDLLYEFARFKKKKIKNYVVDEPDTRTPCHGVQGCEYAAAHGLPYVKPKDRAKRLTAYDRELMEQKRRRQKQRAMAALDGGVGISLGPQGD